MRKSVENLKTSKVTGGIRHPNKSRRKFQTDRFPNEALLGEQITVTRKTRGNNRKTSLKTAKDVNDCLIYTSPSPRDRTRTRMQSSA